LVTAISAGSATITVTTNDGSFTDNCELTIVANDIGSDTTNITKQTNQETIRVYPNPVSDVLYIARETNSLATIRIFNIHGNKVTEIQSSDFSTRVKIKDLGLEEMVLIQVISDQGVFMQKVIVK
jgi:uncharacterized protein YjdB